MDVAFNSFIVATKPNLFWPFDDNDYLDPRCAIIV